MIEQIGDLWDLHNQGCWVGIPTNGAVRPDGTARMGAGLALEASQRFPILQKALGARLLAEGNHVFAFVPFRIITIPTKSSPWKDADPGLIRIALKELHQIMDTLLVSKRLYLPRLGCGLGKLPWDGRDGVRKLMVKEFGDDDRVVVVSNKW